ncbi:DUF4129 domain-containing protein [Cellulomonas cellasea]|uniref:Protein-glutamine gamma-glutamyltransferase-like C-terminal domain-containing protein n=1 Tax=Cellulomonas cellasea TaxID=43670 RepID=A0A7W4YAU1_9CELL|nr:DUF4129 domain-containing protein [Cellulomonas cellasea]MBB2922928.1 hypothetical protein [Cellulomonas cellasea]
MTLLALVHAHAGALVTARAGDVPVEPGADEARRWVERELLEPVYDDSPSLLERILDWVSSLFDDVPALGLDGRTAALVIVVLLAVVAAVVLYVAGPVRRSRRSGSGGIVLGGDDTRTAAQLRAAADAAASRGDWHEAVAERFRAVVRSLEERTVLDERPGRTAHEAVEAAAYRLPGSAPALRDAGRLFDDVVYGDQPAGPSDDARLREVDAAVTAERPLGTPADDAGTDRTHALAAAGDGNDRDRTPGEGTR